MFLSKGCNSKSCGLFCLSKVPNKVGWLRNTNSDKHGNLSDFAIKIKKRNFSVCILGSDYENLIMNFVLFEVQNCSRRVGHFSDSLRRSYVPSATILGAFCTSSVVAFDAKAIRMFQPHYFFRLKYLKAGRLKKQGNQWQGH